MSGCSVAVRYLGMSSKASVHHMNSKKTARFTTKNLSRFIWTKPRSTVGAFVASPRVNRSVMVSCFATNQTQAYSRTFFQEPISMFTIKSSNDQCVSRLRRLEIIICAIAKLPKIVRSVMEHTRRWRRFIVHVVNIH